MNAAPERPNPALILGSASPRRAALLRQLGLTFEQVVSPDPEPEPDGRSPEEFVCLSAAAKARSVQRWLASHRPPAPAPLVIGADTVVVLGDQVLGKPADASEAGAMLRALSGRSHTVFTGVALAHGDAPLQRDAVATRVGVRRLSPDDVDWYVASGEPLDKAGAYGIQGLGARFIERIEGCYYNVVGLPLARLAAMLEQSGYRFCPIRAHDETSR